jgi:hypothetical protein
VPKSLLESECLAVLLLCWFASNETYIQVGDPKSVLLMINTSYFPPKDSSLMGCSCSTIWCSAINESSTLSVMCCVIKALSSNFSLRMMYLITQDVVQRRFDQQKAGDSDRF